MNDSFFALLSAAAGLNFLIKFDVLTDALPQNPKTPYVSDVKELYLIYSFVQIYSSMSSQRRFGASGPPMRHDPQLLTYVLLLRFGKVPSSDPPQPLMNYTSIARLIRKLVTTVIELVKAALGASMHGYSENLLSRSKFS